MVEEYTIGDRIDSLVFWENKQLETNENVVVLYITSSEHIRFTLHEYMPWVAFRCSSEEYWGEVRKQYGRGFL